MRFELWAPFPSEVDLLVGDRRIPMTKDGNGRWSAEVGGATPGTRYGFSLDGGPLRPDPRSAHQPDGIDQASAVYDHFNDPVFVRHQPHGYGLDAAWDHALHAVLTGETSGYYEDFGTLDALVRALEQAWVYDGAWSQLRRRPHGHPVTGLTPDRFVVAAQNHDQVGNRAAGERLPALTSWGRLHVAAALLLTTPFVPMLFQGEEWGAATPFQYFTDHPDPDLARSVSEGRRREFAAFGWLPDAVPDPQDRATFERSVLDWDEPRRAPHDGLLRWHRDLIRLRRELSDLSDPAVGAQACHDEGLLVVTRGSVVVVADLHAGARRWPAPAGTTLLMASDPGIRLEGDAVVLPVDSVALLRTPQEPSER